MRRWTPEEKAEIARRFAAGETVPALCVAYGTTWNMVRKFLALHGAKRLRAGGRSYLRNLTDEEKAAIVARYAAGESGETLRDAFACSFQTIYRTLRAAGIEARSNSESHTHCALNAAAFDAPSPERDRWLGFLFADGCIHRHKGGGAPALKVGLAEKDAGHLEKLRAFLGSTHTIRHVTVTADRSGKRHAVADLYIRSAPLVASLERLGMRGKSLERVALPEFEDSGQFWGGLIDGDGHVGWQGSPLLSLVGGEVLLGQFAAYLMRHGAGPAPVKKPHPNCWRVTVSGDRAQRAIELLYVGASAALERKAATAADILTR